MHRCVNARIVVFIPHCAQSISVQRQRGDTRCLKTVDICMFLMMNWRISMRCSFPAAGIATFTFAQALFFFVVQPALFRRARGSRRAAQLRRRGCGADQICQPCARVLAVAGLAAKALGADDQYAVAGQPPARKRGEPRFHMFRQIG